MPLFSNRFAPETPKGKKKTVVSWSCCLKNKGLFHGRVVQNIKACFKVVLFRKEKSVV